MEESRCFILPFKTNKCCVSELEKGATTNKRKDLVLTLNKNIPLDHGQVIISHAVNEKSNIAIFHRQCTGICFFWPYHYCDSALSKETLKFSSIYLFFIKRETLVFEQRTRYSFINLFFHRECNGARSTYFFQTDLEVCHQNKFLKFMHFLNASR